MTEPQTLPPVPITVQGGGGSVTLEVFHEGGRLICGIYRLEGRLTLPPRRWLATIRDELARIEHLARAAGCQEMRIGGRDWSRILPDYQRLDGVPNGLRKAL